MPGFYTSILIAFLGGMLSLLPACGPALLPAFFTYSFTGQPRKAVWGTALFALGFSLLFIPFALGVRVVFVLLPFDQQGIYLIAGIILILLGAARFLSVNIPIFYSNKAVSSRLNLVGLGMVFGLTSGACIAPVLGSIATLAATSGSLPKAILFLFVFEIGMFVPLLLAALGLNIIPLVKRLASSTIRITVRDRRFEIKSVQMISSCIFILLGVSFIFPRITYYFIPPAIRDFFIDLLFSVRF